MKISLLHLSFKFVFSALTPKLSDVYFLRTDLSPKYPEFMNQDIESGETTRKFHLGKKLRSQLVMENYMCRYHDCKYRAEASPAGVLPSTSSRPRRACITLLPILLPQSFTTAIMTPTPAPNEALVLSSPSLRALTRNPS